MDTKKWLTWTLVGAGAIVLAAVALVLLASAGAIVAQASPSERSASTAPAAALGPGYPGGHGWGPVDRQELLAEELGISLDELEDAQRAAFEAALDQAVEAGHLTEEQADQILEDQSPFGHGFGRRTGGHHGFGFGRFGVEIDFEALLAEELDISVEELETAKQAAGQAALEQLVEEGYLTEEQAEMADAAAALREFIDRDAMMAEALGISLEDLQAARSDGVTLPELLEQRGLDAESFRENMVAAHQSAIEQAVQEGIITQAQADQLGEAPFGHFGPGGRGCEGRGGIRGGGRFFGPGPRPGPSNSDSGDA